MVGGLVGVKLFQCTLKVFALSLGQFSRFYNLSRVGGDHPAGIVFAPIDVQFDLITAGLAFVTESVVVILRSLRDISFDRNDEFIDLRIPFFCFGYGIAVFRRLAGQGLTAERTFCILPVSAQ